MSTFENERVEAIFKECEKLLNFVGMSWWIIDLEDNPNVFYCNKTMCDTFALDHSLLKHSVSNTCPIAGDYNKNIAIRNSAQARQIFAEYADLRQSKIEEYNNRFPYYDDRTDETFYFTSRARALVKDSEGHAQVLLGIIEPEINTSELYIQAKTDGLTGLYNRREFDSQLNFFINLARREDQTIALIMCDIDFFKNYNDTLGHYAGDSCLHDVAQSIRHACERANDSVFRYGGEEFAIIIYGNDLDVFRLAEKIRREVQTRCIPHPNTELNVVTLSVGFVAVKPDNSITAKDIINYADKALYDAKERGRNSCSRYDIVSNTVESLLVN